MSESTSDSIGESTGALENLIAHQRWKEACELARSEATRTTAPERQAKIWALAGTIALERLANAALAIECLEASKQALGDQPAVDERLRALYEKRRDWRKLMALARTEAERQELASRLEPKPWWRRWFGG